MGAHCVALRLGVWRLTYELLDLHAPFSKMAKELRGEIAKGQQSTKRGSNGNVRRDVRKKGPESLPSDDLCPHRRTVQPPLFELAGIRYTRRFNADITVRDLLPDTVPVEKA